LDREQIARIAAHYASGSAWERFHVHQRLRFFPHDVLLPFLPGTGTVLDIGCGFGLLAWYLTEHRPALTYYGADIDARKIALARASFARRPGLLDPARLHLGDVRQWGERPRELTVVAMLDVLLLLPLSMQREFFDFACRSLSHGANARLLLKIQPMLRGTAHLRTWLQETMMVRILRKTKTSGALFFRQDPRLYAAWGSEHGLACEEHSVPTYPPSILLVLRRPG
jgi:SAM-dependent methyltransferase